MKSYQAEGYTYLINFLGVCNMNKFKFNTMEEYQNEIERLAYSVKRLDNINSSLIRKCDYLIDVDDMGKWNKAIEEIEERTQIKSRYNELYQLQNEFIEFCRKKFIDEGIYKGTLKSLFEKENDILEKHKLINALMLF